MILLFAPVSDSGQAWQAHFDAIYSDPASVADLRAFLDGTFFDASLAGRLTLFAVISLLWLISGQAWQSIFDAIYGDPAPVADLRTSSNHVIYITCAMARGSFGISLLGG